MYNLRHHLESCLTKILQILTYEWDPLQIKDKPNAEEEYEDYPDAICNLLVLQKPLIAITEYLWEVETRVLELDGNFAHTEEIAKRLYALTELEYKYSTSQRTRNQHSLKEPFARPAALFLRDDIKKVAHLI